MTNPWADAMPSATAEGARDRSRRRRASRFEPYAKYFTRPARRQPRSRTLRPAIESTSRIAVWTCPYAGPSVRTPCWVPDATRIPAAQRCWSVFSSTVGTKYQSFWMRSGLRSRTQ